MASGEKLAMRIIACVAELFAERWISINPAHQVARGGARVAIGEIEERKLLFAITADFHKNVCLRDRGTNIGR